MENKKIVNIQIWTPYLIKEISEECSEQELKAQKEMFGYDPSNLLTENKIVSERNLILLDKERESTTRPEFIIAGCTIEGEAEVKKCKGSGALIARYSIFYGEASDYTGSYPDESGYAFDIPKSTDLVRSLLKYDNFLEGIILRNETKIRNAITEFNKINQGTIIITPYLPKALEYN